MATLCEASARSRVSDRQPTDDPTAVVASCHPVVTARALDPVALGYASPRRGRLRALLSAARGETGDPDARSVTSLDRHVAVGAAVRLRSPRHLARPLLERALVPGRELIDAGCVHLPHGVACHQGTFDDRADRRRVDVADPN